ncbi:carboxynorspermidine decarboxylase [[Clostridium] polysaccharolyticum]|jgi:carboxynorspermidine decarboxylase|uniref:Carboxynorspermidine decarboxylase n=1 Tax=[Clostridium] polysaccharolyticum TaxID=29364 RepID=A0A1I0CXU5_9FIRM|nr:carboxynorspermidine decarboxylase [[Clostridium] polysaccharolyticum]SET24687.1 carboxynorspermidine decarboxylase [[Clostridium] polysaccharolyticum]
MEKTAVQTPYYVVEEKLLKENLEKLKYVIDKTGCKILLAQKAFSMFSVYPTIAQYLDGTTASSLFEAKLGKEKFGKETHIFNPAYDPRDFEEIVSLADHIVFNSVEQWQRFRFQVEKADHPVQCGIRLNPEYAEVETDLYNPCFTGSRLGTTLANLEGKDVSGIDGFHFHTMCEQNSDVLKRTIPHIEEKFGKYLKEAKWINLGGGHHITRQDYDMETLIQCILYLKEKYQVQIYLEPGEAVVLNTGFLVSTVLDITQNGLDIAILDTSAACHMPDVLEMPYRPEIIGAGKPEEKKYTYRLGGPTCLAGDVIGDYSFDKPLEIGSQVVFCDMAHYSMVKNNTFNGINLPSIAIHHTSGELEIVRRFRYTDFMMRLS